MKFDKLTVNVDAFKRGCRELASHPISAGTEALLAVKKAASFTPGIALSRLLTGFSFTDGGFKKRENRNNVSFHIIEQASYIVLHLLGFDRFNSNFFAFSASCLNDTQLRSYATSRCVQCRNHIK